MVQQALLEQDGRYYDELTIAWGDGRRQPIYFDISEFFPSFSRPADREAGNSRQGAE